MRTGGRVVTAFFLLSILLFASPATPAWADQQNPESPVVAPIASIADKTKGMEEGDGLLPLLKFTGSCLHCRMANSGGMVGMITSGRSVQAALGSADARLLVRRSPPRLDFRQIAGMRADGPTPRKNRARPAWISPAVRVPGDRHGAGVTRPGVRAV